MNISSSMKRAIILAPVFLVISFFISVQPDGRRDGAPRFKAEPVMIIATESIFAPSTARNTAH